jgi:hypothetical protein
MRFFYFLSFLLIIGVLFSFLPVDFRDKIMFPFQSDDKYLSKAEQSVNQILYETSSSINKKYKINTVGTSASMPGRDVRQLGLEFETRQRLTKEQLRKLLIQFGEELLHNINSNEDIQPYLTKRPFTLENVEIIIYNHDQQGYWLYDPEIGIGHLYKGKIEYNTHDPDKEYGYKNTFEETYEEALKLIQEQDHPHKEETK